MFLSQTSARNEWKCPRTSISLCFILTHTMKLNLPNIFTLSRAVIAPIFLALLLMGGRVQVVSAVVLFIVAAITDYLDGWFARKYAQSSAWGTLVDPLADKVLTTAAFLGFAMLGLVAWWMVVLVILRDIATTVFRTFADSIGKPLITSWSAKVKTFVQMTFIIVVLVFLAALQLDLPAWIHQLASWILFPLVVQVTMLLVTVITVWTGVEYFLTNRAILRRPCVRLLRSRALRRLFKRRANLG
jgi:CDP-diacylglycerol--glycerol-3-phosphate 3-phosphatidyltransferase